LDNFFIARSNMIKGQVLPNKITDAQIIKIIADLPRHHFVPEAFKDVAYTDKSLEIGGGRYLMAAHIFARMVQAIEVKKSDVILDVACGSGYSSAIFASLAKKIVAVESDADLAAKANLNLKKLDIGNVIVLNNKLTDGHTEAAPYDIVFINGAIKSPPHSLMSQLAEGGRLVTVVADSDSTGRAMIFRRQEERIVKTDLFDAVLNIIPEFSS
jgi:protein-L-isoaspartate(D-aspartate) O-methyltransferase